MSSAKQWYPELSPADLILQKRECARLGWLLDDLDVIEMTVRCLEGRIPAQIPRQDTPH